MLAQICPHCRSVLSANYKADEHASSGGLSLPIEFIHWIAWTVIILIVLSVTMEFLFIADDVPFPHWLVLVDLVASGILSYKYRERLPHI
ncbi:hypothetical protein [Massilia oculi]|uniref:hypothetical protein n=1 Tax=Massilia oculi TaxID=945844 RepID=UPI001AAF7D0A|nr:hypothetical protein [Massilia oculi]